MGDGAGEADTDGEGGGEADGGGEVGVPLVSVNVAGAEAPSAVAETV